MLFCDFRFENIYALSRTATAERRGTLQDGTSLMTLSFLAGIRHNDREAVERDQRSEPVP